MPDIISDGVDWWIHICDQRPLHCIPKPCYPVTWAPCASEVPRLHLMAPNWAVFADTYLYVSTEYTLYTLPLGSGAPPPSARACRA